VPSPTSQEQSIVAGNNAISSPNITGFIDTDNGFNLTFGDPRLAPLGHYGGPTQTMPPLAGSPAIDAASTTNPGGTDQRGLARFTNAALDIGAVEAGPILIVDTLDDTNNGDFSQGELSLREAISNTSNPFPFIHFSSALNGQTITLTEGPLSIEQSLFIDASNLSDGLTLDANGDSTNHRVLAITSGNHNITLSSLTLTRGNTDENGGCILNNSNLSITNSTLANNSANNGGAIENNGNLFINNSTLANNSAENGGAISNNGNLSISNSTLSNNSAEEAGGGIINLEGSLIIDNSPLAENSAVTRGGSISNHSDLIINSSTLSSNSALDSGGAISNNGSLNLSNSIVAGNDAPTNPNILGIITTDNGFNLTNGDPLLLPLTDNGGPTKTLHPLAESPAIDSAGSIDPGGFDQRGRPRFFNNSLDIGAVEVQFDVTRQLIVSSLIDVNQSGFDLTLREAISIAPPGSAITFSPSLNNRTITLTQGQLLINTPLTIDASSLPNGVTINVNGNDTPNSRIFEITERSRNVTLDSLTLTGGSASEGGAILNHSPTLSINNSTLSNNLAIDKGGAISNNGTLNFNHSTLTNNSVTNGHGGAISNNGTLNLNNSTLARNSSSGSGGAINTSDGSILTINNSTLSQNSSTSDGGAIFNDQSTFTLNNSIITGNNAPNNPNISGTITSDNGFNLTSGEPLLNPLANYGGPTLTMLPLVGSPAIDAAGTTDPGGTDQRGLSRFANGALDIGAVEVGLFVVDTINDENDGDVTQGNLSLREAIIAATPLVDLITFSTTLNGQTITLTEGQLLIDKSLSIDASNLPDGLTIDANGEVNRHRVLASLITIVILLSTTAFSPEIAQVETVAPSAVT